MKTLRNFLIAAVLICATSLGYAQTGPITYRTDTQAALLGITLYGSDTKAVAFVGGSAARGDGLGGLYYWDGTSTTATNVYAVFRPTYSGAPTTGRWFKLPTAVAWQNSAVTVGNDTTYGFKFLRGPGQTNFFGIGADNNIAYLQTFNGKNLHINNQGNHTILNATAGNVGIGTGTTDNKLTIDATGAVGFYRGSSGKSMVGMDYLHVDGGAGDVMRFLGSVGSATFDQVNMVIARTTGNVGIGTTTPSAKLAINGGLHVGGDSDPGDNNLAVDGTALITGAATLGSTLVVTNGSTLRGGAAVGTAATAVSIAQILTATADLNYPSIVANSVTNLTITVAGAGTNSTVSASCANGTGFDTAGVGILEAWVSATNTVTVKAVNTTAGALDPASTAVRVTVFQY